MNKEKPDEKEVKDATASTENRDQAVDKDETPENIDDIKEETDTETAEMASGEDENEPEVQDEVARLSDELSESKDKYLRLYSEFENFRRRTAREKLEMVQTANEDLMSALLPIIDDFERAEKSFDDENIDVKAVKEGVQLIYNKFKKVLEQKGLEVMDGKEGMDFNPDYHEAITQIPAPKKNLKGKVVDIIEKGYLLKEKVIRYAKVVIGN